jgi:hypothetical protein
MNNILVTPAIGMVLLMGDLAYSDCNAPAWDFWDDQNMKVSSVMPMMMSAGNHEQEQEYMTSKTYTAFEARYQFPGAKPAVFGPIISNNALISTIPPGILTVTLTQ